MRGQGLDSGRMPCHSGSMFIGHFGVGFGAKVLGKQVSLGTWFLAVQFLDLLWPTFLLLGLERVEISPGITAVTPLDFVSYPISHSLLAVCGWGLLFGAVYWLIAKNSKTAVLLGACVVSHWILDVIVHRPDLPLFPGDSPLLGFGLWNSPIATLVLEGAILAVGVRAYLSVSRTRNRAGTIGFWGLIAFLVLIYMGNLFGPPPPDTTSIAWAGQLQWLLVIWAYWVDRNRVAA